MIMLEGGPRIDKDISAAGRLQCQVAGLFRTKEPRWDQGRFLPLYAYKTARLQCEKKSAIIDLQELKGMPSLCN